MEALKDLRRQKGWSQKDLSEYSGVGQDTISGIESGRHEPRPSTLRKLAGALEVEVADFFKEPVPLGEAPREAGLVQVDELPGLRKTREKHGLSHDELSFRTGLPVDEIKDLENGRRAPRPGTVELLARVLDCYKGDLFVPIEIMEAFQVRDAEENARLQREAENLTPNDIRTLKLASPAFRKLSKAFEKSSDQEGREVG